MILAVALAVVAVVKITLPRPLIHKGKTVEQWAADLNAGDQKARDEAAGVFKELGARAVPDLITLLRGQDSWFRKKVFAVAPKLPSPVRRLIFRTMKPVYWPDVHIVAARALGIIGPDAKEAAPLLNEALRQIDVPLLNEASIALGKIGKDSVPFLINDLEHRSQLVRHAAAYGLAVAGTNSLPAIPALVERFGDSDESVRSSASFALSCMGTSAVPAVLQAIRERKGLARRTAIGAATTLHSPNEFIPALLAVLKDDNDATNRLTAATALAVMRYWKKEVVAAMIDLLKDPDASVRLRAVKNLGETPWKAHAAIPALNELLNDPNEEVRTAARETLEKINSAPVPQAQAK